MSFSMQCVSCCFPRSFWGVGRQVGAAESLLIVGPSGCGKSSLLRAVAGCPLLLPLPHRESRYRTHMLLTSLGQVMHALEITHAKITCTCHITSKTQSCCNANRIRVLACSYSDVKASGPFKVDGGCACSPEYGSAARPQAPGHLTCLKSMSVSFATVEGCLSTLLVVVSR